MIRKNIMHDKRVISIVVLHIGCIISAILLSIQPPEGLWAILSAMLLLFGSLFCISTFSIIILSYYKRIKEKLLVNIFTSSSIVTFYVTIAILEKDYSFDYIGGLLLYMGAIYFFSLILHLILKLIFSKLAKFHFLMKIWNKMNYYVRGAVIGILLFEVPYILLIISDWFSSSFSGILEIVFISIFLPASGISSLLESFLSTKVVEISMHFIYPLIGLLIGAIVTYIKKEKRGKK